ncbi:cyclic AMP-responsive element-binding protein 3-like protein 4 isoform X4 [Python bivittatus]|uniref:Cyclic AMP-responsive element-binding protein 3-like protein 4 isoform X4 n=1 Tax=Python bivittatus TaxID=176946 RepID=A0A9F5MT25_PYTBI|nr:cyclic AMP-responsive element-binding protein 3-like protein 4 isoform X4 [Python bivittatus]
MDRVQKTSRDEFLARLGFGGHSSELEDSARPFGNRVGPSVGRPEKPGRASPKQRKIYPLLSTRFVPLQSLADPNPADFLQLRVDPNDVYNPRSPSASTESDSGLSDSPCRAPLPPDRSPPIVLEVLCDTGTWEDTVPHLVPTTALENGSPPGTDPSTCIPSQASLGFLEAMTEINPTGVPTDQVTSGPAAEAAGPPEADVCQGGPDEHLPRGRWPWGVERRVPGDPPPITHVSFPLQILLVSFGLFIWPSCASLFGGSQVGREDHAPSGVLSRNILTQKGAAEPASPSAARHPEVPHVRTALPPELHATSVGEDEAEKNLPVEEETALEEASEPQRDLQTPPKGRWRGKAPRPDLDEI